MAAGVYRRGADLARTLETETLNEVNGAALACREALGVVGAIVPWNSPEVLLAGKVSAHWQLAAPWWRNPPLRPHSTRTSWRRCSRAPGFLPG